VVTLSSRPSAIRAASSRSRNAPSMASGGTGGSGAGTKARTVSPPAVEVVTQRPVRPRGAALITMGYQGKPPSTRLQRNAITVAILQG